MQNAGYLLAAYSIVWAILFIYILYLLNKQKKLQQEIDMLKEIMKEKNSK